MSRVGMNIDEYVRRMFPNDYQYSEAHNIVSNDNRTLGFLHFYSHRGCMWIPPRILNRVPPTYNTSEELQHEIVVPVVTKNINDGKSLWSIVRKLDNIRAFLPNFNIYTFDSMVFSEDGQILSMPLVKVARVKTKSALDNSDIYVSHFSCPTICFSPILFTDDRYRGYRNFVVGKVMPLLTKKFYDERVNILIRPDLNDLITYIKEPEPDDDIDTECIKNIKYNLNIV